MGSTNKTTNYDLPQFIGSDKPTWLVDVNGAFSAIDTQMKANADAASAAQTTANTADGKADTNASAISTLDGQINGASGIAADVTTLQGNVNTINSLIGNGEPTTTDKTLIGAINELDADLGNYADMHSFLEGEAAATVDFDGVKTFGEACVELYTAFNTILGSLAANEYIEIFYVSGLMGSCLPLDAGKLTSANVPFALGYFQMYGGGGDMSMGCGYFSATAENNGFTKKSIASDNTITDSSIAHSTVPAVGNSLAIVYQRFKAI